MRTSIIVCVLSIASGLKLRSDPYQSDDQGVRLAKQRLLSMDPNRPGIRYRVSDQLTKLVDVDASIKALEASVQKFQGGLSQVAGIIDLSKANNGLVPQMTTASHEITRLSKKLSTLHKQATAQIANLYSNANNIPVQLTTNLQRTLDNLVKTYNQQIINQVHTLDRQRQSAISQGQSDTKTLGRTIQAVQSKQLVAVKKLIKQIQSDRTTVLAKSMDLNSKFIDASNVVNTALAGVKAKSSGDLAKVEAIVNDNKKALVDYISQAGDTWTTSLQATIARAARDAAKGLDTMSQSLTSQFAAAKKKANDDLNKVDASVDNSVQQIATNVAAITRRFDLAIKNATTFTDRALGDLRQPILDINDQITAAGSMLTGVQQDATVGASAISSNASRTATALTGQFQAAAQGVAGNPGFTSVAGMATQVYNQASTDITTAEGSANARVSALEEQLGNNDAAVGSISANLQDTIDQQTKDFQTSTQVQSANVRNQVDTVTGRLTSMADDNAATIDEVQANADKQLADLTGRAEDGITASQASANATIGTVGAHINASVSQAGALIDGAFSAILADGQNVLQGANNVAGAASNTADQLANVSAAITQQNAQVNADLDSAGNQIASLHQLGSDAVDRFSQDASAATAGAVNEFGQQANAAVDSYRQGLASQLQALIDAQTNLQSVQGGNAAQNAMVQAGLRANLTMARNLLNQVKGNSSITDATVRAYVASVLQDFKDGSMSEVAGLRSATASQLGDIANDLKGRVAGAGEAVANQTQGFIDSLLQLSGYVSSHSSDLDQSVTSATGAVTDFKSLVDSLIAQIGSVSDGVKLYFQNTSSLVSGKMDETDEYLSETKADTMDKIDQTWTQLRTAMESVDGSTASKIKAFRDAVNDSMTTSDMTVRNFTSYLDGMLAYERQTAASRIAVQRGLLQSILQNALSANNTNSASSREMLARLQAVLGTASGSVNASSDTLQQQKEAQEALINSFGLTTASRVSDLMAKLEANSASFTADVNASSTAATGDSSQLLSAAGQGVSGVVDMATGIANTVDLALNETSQKFRDSQVAMAALSAETGNLSNITEAQLGAVLRAMMASQTMYSGELDGARKNNSDNIAMISGVVADFVTLVNQTLVESDDLISSVDANYSDASMKLGSKMDTIIGYITREANAVSESADSSGQMLKSLLTKNGAMEEGIRSRLEQLASQQDAFATSVHDQLQGFIARLNDDTSKMSSARLAATNKLYDTLHKASADFASNAAQWQSQRLQAAAGSLIQVDEAKTSDVKKMTDDELLADVLRHARRVDTLVQA